MISLIIFLIITTATILCRNVVITTPLVGTTQAPKPTVRPTQIETYLFYDGYQPPPPICIVVICNKRVGLLKKTLNSIVNANGFADNGINNLFISQSGNESAVSEVVDEWPNVYKNMDKVSKVSNRLARHFRWTFKKLFKETNCDGFIVVEDDLELSPDFLDYFQTVLPLLENDDTLITASLWNDLGFKHNTHDKAAVKRTDFFPGLGWYLSRRVWDDILGPEWPDHDWDWYVRDKALKLGMDSLIPEIPRDFHVASTGTYMTRSFFDKYFKNININRDSMFKWEPEYTSEVSPLDVYKKKVERDVRGANHLTSTFSELEGSNNGVVVAWVKDFGKVRQKGRVKSKCRLFLRETGIWEGEPERGRWNGINHVWSQRLNAYLYVIDMGIAKSGFVHYLKPPNVKVFNELEVCDAFRFL